MRTDQRIIAKRRKDRSTPPVKTTESIAKESIVEMRDITPESIITVTAFRDETMDMRIPFKIPAESMQDHDKTRGKVFEPEAIRALTDQKKAKILIIAMTANAFSEDIQHSLAAGMDAHISKPVEMKVLKKTIRNIKFGEGGIETQVTE